jgi:signal transduction protein with GAF and PtsI domain
MRISDEILRLRREEELVEGELGMHRHLADDATRDAIVTGEPIERAEARDASKDVTRLEAALEGARRELERLQKKRDRLLDRLQKE